jgi:hypothetical protein
MPAGRIFGLLIHKMHIFKCLLSIIIDRSEFSSIYEVVFVGSVCPESAVKMVWGDPDLYTEFWNQANNIYATHTRYSNSVKWQTKINLTQ